MKKFPWGKVIDRIEYDFDGKTLEIVKAHPWKSLSAPKSEREFDAEKVIYFCDELGVSTNSVMTMLLYWIVCQGIETEQEASILFLGVCRMLKIDHGEGW